MSKSTKLGIWMDHSDAHLIAFEKESSTIKIISNNFGHDDMQSALVRSEQLMHNKRQQQNAAYYKKLGDAILIYSEVLLFGPTDAKMELFNILDADIRFEKIIIDVLAADKMTENEQYAFVKKHFAIQSS